MTTDDQFLAWLHARKFAHLEKRERVSAETPEVALMHAAAVGALNEVIGWWLDHRAEMLANHAEPELGASDA